MPKKEQTPFVIDFKQRNAGNYGAATPCTSRQIGGQDKNNSQLNLNNNNNNAGNIPHTPSVYCLHGHGRNNITVLDHCHRQRSEGVDIKARKKLIIASILCLFFMCCEIVGGVLSNSLAIATDAAHLLTDFASFMISLFAIWLAGRPPTQRMSFGWYRAEVIGALVSVMMIWFITAILVWLAIGRIINQDFEVDAKIMLITSGLAILVNIIMGFQLQHGHSHGSLGGGAGHGHSHGGAAKKKKEKVQAIENTTVLALNQNNNNKAGSNHHIGNSASYSLVPSSTTSEPCPVSPNERLEDGITNAGLEAADAQMPAAGLSTFSYQNTPAQSDVNNEIAAVMAETSPGAHHHGGSAANDAVNLNVRAAFIHVLGDTVQSVGVFLAALLIYFRPDWAIADPICTFIFSIIVLLTTFGIVKDALLVLMEGTPSYMHYAEVLDIFQQIDGVERVHNLRIWALSVNKIAVSVHLAIRPGANPQEILEKATTAVHLRYNFFETTIQIEEFRPTMENCAQCVVPST